MKTDLRSLYKDELYSLMAELSGEKYRADQLFMWMHSKLKDGFSEMGNIPKKLKDSLDQAGYGINPSENVLVLRSKLDGTRKYLFRLWDGNIIESVFMQYEHGNTVCVSSQAGCRMGCRFCASTIDGLVRNLEPSEMLSQVYAIARDEAAAGPDSEKAGKNAGLNGDPVSNVVIMGSGEPLDNYDNVIRFIRLLNDKDGLNISQRNITLSTCGIVPGIRRLIEEDLKINLALSLHAPNDEKRKQLMPIANKYGISEILDACVDYYNSNRRRLTIEYSLIKGVNDSDEDAAELSHLLRGMNVLVNLIPVNPVRERDYQSTGQARVRAFQNKLEKNNINVTIRRELGRDIEGACGQLRRRYEARTGSGKDRNNDRGDESSAGTD
ncbi:MAG: 23S rRNA (adenine(2503)-C(2))-methyltransferase RlmN [Lachnospiraceae bacterium]|nr:23S rRNA (adenine(2503)-C(2))-methyltransferase RlmN [Lachnospiraceae bacterium]